MLMSSIKCGVGGKKGENVRTVSKEFTAENVCIVTALFRRENSVGGEVLGGGLEWKLGCTMSSILSMSSVTCL